MNQPLRRHELERQIIERVLDNLAPAGLDPERHERDLVHQPLERGVVGPVAVARAIPIPAAIGAAEEPCWIVLNPQHLAAVERFAADERVVAFFEPEPQEVRRRDELGLTCLLQQSVQVGRRRRALLRTRSGRFDGRRTGPRRCLAFRQTPLARLLAFQVIGFELAALRLGDRHAIHLHRTAYEEAVPDVPRVLAALTPEVGPIRPADVDALALVEHVLLQLLPVLVALRQHLAHEGIEIGLCRQGDTGEDQCGNDAQSSSVQFFRPMAGRTQTPRACRRGPSRPRQSL